MFIWNRLSATVSSLGGLFALIISSIHLAWMVGIIAYILQRGRVSIVGIDTGKYTAVDSSRAFNVDVTLTLG